MPYHINFSRILCASLVCLSAFTVAALAQQQGAGNAQQTDDVLKINTELVQTGVTVTDKQGRFVDGLKKEDFELRVDGQPASVSFFESILTGSQRDQLARVSQPGQQSPITVKATTPTYRRRTVIFFIDDLHLSPDSGKRTSKMILNFIDKEMGQNDLVAIASASGQIGFLQQFTDNKEVLRAAVSRLNPIPYGVRDIAKGAGATMTEYMALAIERRDDPGVFKFFVEDCLMWAPKSADKRSSYPRAACETDVKNRARLILLESSQVVSNTYYSLETLLRSAERLPGSKLAFFVSDGFLAEGGARASTGYDKLGRITDEARRAGVVIYTIDARGLVSGQLDATNNVAYDPNGVLANSSTREVSATQEALNAIASDTGGRALRNQNFFEPFVGKALEETSRYYLLAWRPEVDEQKNQKFKKIEVSVTGRPDLVVRSARGFFTTRQQIAAASAKDDRKDAGGKSAASGAEKTSQSDLGRALSDFFPTQALPLQLSLIYLDTPSSGTVLTSSIQAPAELLSYGAEGRDPAELSLAGVVLNDQGKPVTSFKTGLKVNPVKAGEPVSSKVIYNHRAPLKPGIYQVRVAARDNRSGIVGSNMQWVVIPDLSARQLALSSLIVGLESVTAGKNDAGQIQWSVDKRFAHGSHLRFMTFIYNAARRGSAPPDLAAQVQIFRDGQAVINAPPLKLILDASTDPARVPFTADINLGALPDGRYLLKVTVEDRTAGKTVTQQTPFDVR